VIPYGRPQLLLFSFFPIHHLLSFTDSKHISYAAEEVSLNELRSNKIRMRPNNEGTVEVNPDKVTVCLQFYYT
jgi:hypothetical protein